MENKAVVASYVFIITVQFPMLVLDFGHLVKMEDLTPQQRHRNSPAKIIRGTEQIQINIIINANKDNLAIMAEHTDK